MRLGAQVEDCGVVGVVDVSKDAQELTINMLHGCGEGLRELVALEDQKSQARV